ncbi:MAG TPA: helix-turn-helix domain-containing protein [Candidatus Cybelea sp.]|nr:helix-turn-helix domain-containing protein [Candidatus Cybelea sp.]
MHAQVHSANADLTNLAVLHGLGRQASSNIMAISSLQKKAPGETLFADGDEADSVFEVVRGVLRLYKLLPDGRRQIVGFLWNGHLLGLAPERNFIYTAEAVTEVTVCRYRRAAFERLIDQHPGFARTLLTAASHELRAAQDQMLLLGRKTATEKVASFILMMAEQQGGDDAEGIDVPMSRNDIADYLGLTIETVCRTLTKLKRDGLISLSTPAHIGICDREKLEEVAAGGIDSDL